MRPPPLPSKIERARQKQQKEEGCTGGKVCGVFLLLAFEVAGAPALSVLVQLQSPVNLESLILYH